MVLKLQSQKLKVNTLARIAVHVTVVDWRNKKTKRMRKPEDEAFESPKQRSRFEQTEMLHESWDEFWSTKQVEALKDLIWAQPEEFK